MELVSNSIRQMEGRGRSREQLQEDCIVDPGTPEQHGPVGPAGSMGRWVDICWGRIHKTRTIMEGLLALLGGSSSL